MIRDPHTVTVYAASVAPLADDRLYAAAYGAVTEARRRKTDRYLRAEDRRLSLGVELLLAHALKAAGRGGLPPELGCGRYGKPCLPDGSLRFSLSHTGEYAVCAVADRELGCDAERLAEADLKLAERFFCPEEAADIAAQPTREERDRLFFRYWTLKESFMKATGLGMKLAPDAFRIVRGREISVIQSVDGRAYGFAEPEGIPGCRCAVCAEGDCRDTVLRTVDLADITREVTL